MSRIHHKGHRHRGRSKPASKDGPPREHIAELHPTSDPPQIKSFEEWELGAEVQRAIFGMDITVPTPIQKLAIGPVLEGRDVIAKAETGTGKTLAFGAPMMARMDPARSTVLALILCPTRELAQQVADVVTALGLPRGVRTALVVGGDPMHPQINALQAGAQVVIGTPGRVLDLYQQRFLSFPWTETVILDEADKMFEIGFLDDIKKILSYMPDERQTLLFSATFPTEVLKLARAETNNPVEVATATGTSTVDSIEQSWMPVNEEDRALVLTRLLEQSGEKDVFLVFCDRRTEVDRLLRRLERLPFSIKALHGGYDQPSRYRVMSAFRTGEVKALIATDVASRGLDVVLVTHVVNYSVPREVEDYTHRIGRTGRAGRKGTAITFVSYGDRGRWRDLTGRFKWDVAEAAQPGDSRRRRQDSRDSRPRRDERPRREERGRRDSRDERPQRAERGRRDERPRDEERPERGRTRGGRNGGGNSGQGGEPRRQSADRPHLSRSPEAPAQERRPRSPRRDEEERPRQAERQPESRPKERSRSKPAAASFGAISQPAEASQPVKEQAAEPKRRPRRSRDENRSAPERDREKPREEPKAKSKPPSFGSGIG